MLWLRTTGRCRIPARAGTPLNGAGVCGAALADLGFPVDLLRGFALLARTAGLLGHLAEEMRNPAGQAIYREIDEAARYVPPAHAGEHAG
jgi:citrate synthase